MTRVRSHGSDVPFMAWVREQGRLGIIPSLNDVNTGHSLTDVDAIFHRYRTPVKDAIGTRDVQSIMYVEVKTRCGTDMAVGKKNHGNIEIPLAQLNTFMKQNAFRGEINTRNGQLRNYGVFYLLLSNITPSNSQRMQWARFPTFKDGYVMDIYMQKWLTWDKMLIDDIDHDTLIKVLRMDCHPYSLKPNAFKRHHKTSRIVSVCTEALGFDVECFLVKRS